MAPHIPALSAEYTVRIPYHYVIAGYQHIYDKTFDNDNPHSHSCHPADGRQYTAHSPLSPLALPPQLSPFPPLFLCVMLSCIGILPSAEGFVAFFLIHFLSVPFIILPTFHNCAEVLRYYAFSEL